MTTTAPGCSAFQARSCSAVIESDSEQPASGSGYQHGLVWRQDGGGLGHEVDPAEDDHVGVGGGCLAREAQGVPEVVGDVLDLRQLVVVREDDRVSLRRQSADLVRQPLDLAGESSASGVGLDYLEILHRGAPIRPGQAELRSDVRRPGWLRNGRPASNQTNELPQV